MRILHFVTVSTKTATFLWKWLRTILVMSFTLKATDFWIDLCTYNRIYHSHVANIISRRREYSDGVLCRWCVLGEGDIYATANVFCARWCDISTVSCIFIKCIATIIFHIVGDSTPYDASICDDNALYEGPPMTSVYVDSEITYDELVFFFVWFGIRHVGFGNC